MGRNRNANTSKKWGEGREGKGQKQDGLISRQRGPLIAPELRERGDSRDKGKKKGTAGGGTGGGYHSLKCHLLFRPTLRSRLVPSTPPTRLYTSLAVFEFTSRRNLYENLTMLSHAVSLWFYHLSSPFLARRLLFSCTHTHACEGAESVLSLEAEKRGALARGFRPDTRPRLTWIIFVIGVSRPSFPPVPGASWSPTPQWRAINDE